MNLAGAASRLGPGDGGARSPRTDAIARFRYDMVFLAPPWPDIYEVNEDRPHSLEKALRDYERVQSAYLQAGYDPVVLPRETVPARADFILTKIPLIAFDLEQSPPNRPS
ncbi:AAA family ATPase [Sphingopyxis panaciterrae]